MTFSSALGIDGTFEDANCRIRFGSIIEPIFTDEWVEFVFNDVVNTPFAGATEVTMSNLVPFTERGVGGNVDVYRAYRIDERAFFCRHISMHL